MTNLRPYQQKTVTDLWRWFEHNIGNPCLSLPTGSGKSHIIAAICKDAISQYPPTRILMLTHVRELISQNAEKLRYHWPNAPLGIYSAGLKQKDIDQITFAGVQSVRKKASLIGHIDLIIVDEAHTINHNDTGGYRELINDLQSINPKCKVIGLTASPFRLGHGMITDDPAIFDDIIEPVTIQELQYQGYLAKLISKATHKKLSADGVHTRGGEYIESELQKAIDTSDNNVQVIDEVISLAGDRRHWLFFCTGVEHAEHVRDILVDRGITADCVTGKTQHRDRILDEFKNGQIKAITSVGVLTTGFDYPDIDLIVMMRPTMSPGLYLQMAGRGLRLKSHTETCLVLDFAGVVEQHGPITNVSTPKKPGEGIAPSKICPECDEIVHASLMVCPSCGYEFPPVQKEALVLHDDDIQGDGSKKQDVLRWEWEIHTSQKSGKRMLKVTYFGNLNEHPISEYLTVLHDGYAGYKALEKLRVISDKIGVDYMSHETLESLCNALNKASPPTEIVHIKNGKFYDIIDRIWGERKEAEEIEEDDEIIWF